MRWITSMTAWLRRQFKRPRNSRSTAALEDKGRLRTEYFNAALHYHVMGRYAIIGGLVPASGNLVHHAIEFFLKGALIEKLDEHERRRLSHNLRKIWKMYKKERKNSALDKFDTTIQDINEFEKIRYPEEIFRNGMLAEIGFVRNMEAEKARRLKPPGTRYQLALNEVDELVKLIFQMEGLNPDFFICRLNEHSRRYLNHQNQFPL